MVKGAILTSRSEEAAPALFAWLWQWSNSTTAVWSSVPGWRSQGFPGGWSGSYRGTAGKLMYLSYTEIDFNCPDPSDPTHLQPIILMSDCVVANTQSAHYVWWTMEVRGLQRWAVWVCWKERAFFTTVSAPVSFHLSSWQADGVAKRHHLALVPPGIADLRNFRSFSLLSTPFCGCLLVNVWNPLLRVNHWLGYCMHCIFMVRSSYQEYGWRSF